MSLEERLVELAAAVEPTDAAAAQAARERHARLATPPGALGELETIGERLSAVARRCPPPVPERPAAVVAAGDHGVLARGVSPWPAEVTALMVEQFCAGRATVNALAGVVGAQVSVLDVGVATELPRHPRLRGAKVRPGTADLAAGPAMEREEAARAVLAGAGLAEELASAEVDLIVVGDMGIGNTTAAACLLAAFTGAPAEAVTGPGASANADPAPAKLAAVRAGLELHRPGPADPLGALAAVGGLEHAALAGLALGAALERIPLLLDGVSTVAAALAAVALCPDVAGYLLASHRSPEPGAAVGLEHLRLRPVIEAGMRLGEATGGLLAVPIVRAAAAVLAEVATLEEIGA